MCVCECAYVYLVRLITVIGSEIFVVFQLSLHMKTFGSEIYYRHLHGMDKIMEAINTLNPAERIRLLNQGQVRALRLFHYYCRHFSSTVSFRWERSRERLDTQLRHRKMKEQTMSLSVLDHHYTT